MKKLLSAFLLPALILSLSLLTVRQVLAAGFAITRIGTIDVSNLGLGSTLKSYSYTGGTFELAGTASPAATVSIIIDDVTQTTTTDSTGKWTELISSLTLGSHNLSLTSGGEALDFTLNIASATATPTTSTTATTTSATSSSTLPAAGSTGNTFFLLSVAALLLGLGLTLRAKTETA